jgi:hypothetical protein
MRTLQLAELRGGKTGPQPAQDFGKKTVNCYALDAQPTNAPTWYFTLPLIDLLSRSIPTRDTAVRLDCHGGASASLGLAISKGLTGGSSGGSPQPICTTARSRGTCQTEVQQAAADQPLNLAHSFPNFAVNVLLCIYPNL